MAKVHLLHTTGRPGYRRILRVQDVIQKFDIDPGKELVWERANRHTVEMSDELSDSLVAAFPSEFEIVEDGDDDDDTVAGAPATSSSESGASESQS